ncbi:hypothetical protein GCM10007856_03990 [Azospirillum oryzae]|nr:hypothetical protein GCM10007856_03990 [Azospirillum oryzae]
MAAPPLRVYQSALGDLNDRGSMERAVPVAWRYLIVTDERHPSAVVTMDLRNDRGKWYVGAIQRGPMAHLLAEAAQVAEVTVGNTDDEYEARILEIPALYRAALWLHGPSDFYIPLERNDRNSLGVDSYYLSHVKEAASTGEPAE